MIHDYVFIAGLATDTFHFTACLFSCRLVSRQSESKDQSELRVHMHVREHSVCVCVCVCVQARACMRVLIPNWLACVCARACACKHVHLSNWLKRLHERSGGRDDKELYWTWAWLTLKKSKTCKKTHHWSYGANYSTKHLMHTQTPAITLHRQKKKPIQVVNRHTQLVVSHYNGSLKLSEHFPFLWFVSKNICEKKGYIRTIKNISSHPGQGVHSRRIPEGKKICKN